MSYLIDTHCHLHDREFFTEAQAEEMLENAHKNNVRQIICIGTSHEDSLAAAEFAAAHENVYWTYGIHPEYATSDNAGVLSPVSRSGARPSGLSPQADGATPRFANLRTPLRQDTSATPARVQQNMPIAIGEVGLDYHYAGYDREAQIRLFEQMLQLAIDNDLPVSFHVREAFDDFFPVVGNFPNVRGVVHSFTDSKKTLKRILAETDFYVGVNGLATYSTLPTPPLERILLETDAPFLTPVPFRGIINEPAYVKAVAEWLSKHLGLEYQLIERETTNNAKQLFGLQNTVFRQARGV